MDHEAVGPLVGIHTEGAESIDQLGYPVAFLDPELRRARDSQLAAGRRQDRQDRKLVDDPRHDLGVQGELPALGNILGDTHNSGDRPRSIGDRHEG